MPEAAGRPVFSRSIRKGTEVSLCLPRTGGSPVLCGYAGPYLAGDRGESGGEYAPERPERTFRTDARERETSPLSDSWEGSPATMPCSLGREHASLSDLLELSGQRGDCIFPFQRAVIESFFLFLQAVSRIRQTESGLLPAFRLPRLRRLKRNTEQNMSIRKRLQTLSFRTGVIILLMCVPFYVLSFSQMLLPLPVATKGILWAVLFGLAKAFQYSGIAILGVEGYKRVKGWFRRRESAPGGTDAAAVRQTPARCRPDLFSDPSLLEGIRLVIFDFDGTLGDSRRLITDTMLATIGRLGLPRRSREECARTIGLPLKECFSSMIPMDEAQAEQCAATYTEIFNVKNVPGAVTAFPGVEETLGRLSERGIAMSIASSRSHRSLAGLVHDLHLSDYISYLIGADDTAHQKPAADPVVLTLHHFGVRADEALVVGDTEFDILMGRNAGTHTCGVTYGNGSRESLEAAGAERIIC